MSAYFRKDEHSYKKQAEKHKGRDKEEMGIRAKVPKGGTSSTRYHRFESFNQRIAKINIDPIRRRQRLELLEEDLHDAASYFRTSLNRWKDLNLSENFTNFLREVDPLCNNLPQVLHHQQQILATLFRYISKSDTVSLEPLLDLLKNIAHDLGARFEDYFSEAVTLVASLATRHKDVEVIEWSFTCLAWLFKYLSRLLVPNLAPTFKIMAPLLGREAQKLHTTRFAAEAMSFLVRKAALAYPRDRKPLVSLIDAIADDLVVFRSVEKRPDRLELYQIGIMTLLLDSIKGVDRKLHSCGIHVYSCLVSKVQAAVERDHHSLWHILFGLTVGLIHQTDAEGFNPLLRVILDNVARLYTASPETDLIIFSRLIFTSVAVRRGSRIRGWQNVWDAILDLLRIAEDAGPSTRSEISKTSAVALQYSPFDVAISYSQHITSFFESDSYSEHFLPFCNYVCDTGRERFSHFCLPHLSKFIVSHWHQHELQLCLTISKFYDGYVNTSMSCPEGWQKRIMRCFDDAHHQDALTLQCYSYVQLLKYFSLPPEASKYVEVAIGKMLDSAFQFPESDEARKRFAFGAGLKAYAKSSPVPSQHLLSVWRDLCAMAPQYGTVIAYLEGLLLVVKAIKTLDLDDTANPLVDVLVRNLQSASPPLQKASLQLLDELYTAKHSEPSQCITLALMIASSALDLSSARSISIHIRKLAVSYEAASTDPWLKRVVPFFCFGLLSFKLQQAKVEAIAALKQICGTAIGEEIVSEVCFAWLQQPPDDIPEQDIHASDDPPRAPLTDFQCSNLQEVEYMIERTLHDLASATESMQSDFDVMHTRYQPHVANAPLLALQLLVEIPHVAERRSRQLVPMFLSWAVDSELEAEQMLMTETEEITEAEMKSPTTSVPTSPSSTRRLRERKMMLQLFSCFSNPAVLYKSSSVFDALQELLKNGDLDMQKLALKALLTWKNQSLQPYREQLFNLLDEARFRDEIATFLQVDDEDSIVETDHRQVLIPVLLRLLYGRMVARSGTTGGKSGQASRRKAVLQALSRLKEGDTFQLVEIILGPLNDIDRFCAGDLYEPTSRYGDLSTRKLFGTMNMLKDMLVTLGRNLAPASQKVADAILYCMVKACRQLKANEQSSQKVDCRDQQLSLLKSIRQLGLQNFILLFKLCPANDLRPYVMTIFSEVLSPRMTHLAVETAQSVSITLKFFATLTSSYETLPFLVEYDSRVLTAVIDCLSVASAKDEVKLFVIEEILKRIIVVIQAIPEDPPTSNRQTAFHKILHPKLDYLLEHLGAFLRRSPSKDLLGSSIELLSMIAPMVSGSSQSESLLDISTFLLRQPSQRVSPKSKGDLLIIMKHFLPLIGSTYPIYGTNSIYETITSLFGYFKDRKSREILCEVMALLASRDPELHEAAGLCTDLNAFSDKRLDEPDFEKRLKAFHTINELKYKQFTSKQWRPLVYNLLYFVKDNEEMAIRTNAAFGLQRFVEENGVDEERVMTESVLMIKDVLLPAVRSGISNSSELVRLEYLGIMAHLIKCNPSWKEVNDMTTLLVEEDEEASFFSNILHIQQHRRLRALRRLAAEAQKSRLRSSNVAHFFNPLIEHFVIDRGDDESAHNLSAEAVRTLGALACALEWPQFRALFRRYTVYIRSKPHIEKAMIKLIGIIVDSLLQASEEKALVGANLQTRGHIQQWAAIDGHSSVLAMSMPGQEKLTEDLTKNLLPSLTKYLHDKDESTVSLRIPIAISIVKLLKLLPRGHFQERLPPVLTDVCHILRSRAQESRDLTRKTLTDIASLIGPAYFGFIIKELRSALARGYQLHVLSFTVHSMLVATSAIFKPGDLDYCLPMIVAVIMDDIFGATGQEKDAEEYVSKMKEVKSSKSQDSMELIATTTTVDNLIHLVRPLKVLLEEKLDHRMVRKIDELLRRISVGFLRNKAGQDQRVLIFCYEIIADVYKANTPVSTKNSREDYRTKRFLVNNHNAGKAGSRGSTSSYRYKLARFALDIMRSVLQKHVALQSPSNLAGFMPVIGDALVQSNEEVQTSALRLLTVIIKVPLESLDENAPLYVAECVKIVKASTSTTVELAQAALKLVSAILRERRTVEVRETDIAYLLKRLIPELEEPDKQGVAFNFLKAVTTRRIVITEVYEVMDAVSAMMVTNQTKSARNMARGAYFNFVMEYPQTQDRFSKQLGFLVKNLEYKYEEGRQSVMEAIHLVFAKVGDDIAQRIIETSFVPLVMVIVNDESEKCREMAGALLKIFFGRANIERMHVIHKLLRSWITHPDEPIFVRVALQIYGMYLDTSTFEKYKELPSLMMHMARILKNHIKEQKDVEWETQYFALQTFAKICAVAPQSAFASDTASSWASIRQSLTFPHAWVKLSSAKLLGLYFADFARTNANEQITQLPIKGSGGLRLTEPEVVDVARASLRLLSVYNVGDEIASQSVRNLVFLGKIMVQTTMSWPHKHDLREHSPQNGGVHHVQKMQLDEEQADDDDLTQNPNKPSSALGYLLRTSANILRQPPPTTGTQSLTAHHSAALLLGTLISTTPLPLLSDHDHQPLRTILLPLHNLTDPSIPAPFSISTAFTESYKSLQTKAHEIMGTLQKRLGVTDYMTAMQRVRNDVRDRREERRGKKRVENVAHPERSEAKRRKKGLQKKEGRKKRGEQMGRMRKGL